jgi:hypothetical protein
MFQKLIVLVGIFIARCASELIPAKGFDDLMKELNEVENEIKLSRDSLENSKFMQKQKSANQQVNFFTRKINYFLSY